MWSSISNRRRWTTAQSDPHAQAYARHRDCSTFCGAKRMADSEQVQGDSIRGLLRGILMDLRTLIREEISLARVEIREQVGRARAAALSFGIAAAALAFGGI